MKTDEVSELAAKYFELHSFSRYVCGTAQRRSRNRKGRAPFELRKKRNCRRSLMAFHIPECNRENPAIEALETLSGNR